MADETPMTVDAPPADLFKPQTQPNVIDALLKDKAAAREAFVAAEKNVGIDAVVDPTAVLTQSTQPKATEVPEKFRTQTGEVDVEKLKASTKQLDEAIQAKEQKLQEVDKTVSVEEIVKKYNESYRKFRGMPNPGKVAQAMPPPVQPMVDPNLMSNQQLIDLINKDIQSNPGLTVVNLIDMALAKRFEPLEEERQETQRRQNVAELAAKDPRILNDAVYQAISAKLEANPEMWNLKNPYKVAWLEVKDEMRLGEASPNGSASAQPSRPAAPILGGGTPPPPQSAASGPVTPDSVLSAIQQANLKDPAQKQNLAAALKELVDRDFRARRY